MILNRSTIWGYRLRNLIDDLKWIVGLIVILALAFWCVRHAAWFVADHIGKVGALK